MLRSILHAGLVAAALACSIPAVARPAVDRAPLSAYGALPSTELVEVSPSGKRLAFVTVAGEQRTLVVLDTVSREQLGGVGIGDLKVRNLDWIGDEQVMIITSSTMSIPTAGVIEQEVYSAQIYDIAKRSIIDVFRGSRGILPVLFQLPRVVGDANDPIVLVRAYSHETRDRLDLFRVDRDTGRVRLFEVMGINVLNQVLDADGRSVARSEFDARNNEWSLHLRQGGGFKKAWSVIAPIDRPYLVGLGINGDSVIMSADREGLNRNPDEKQNYFDVSLETGAWRGMRFDSRPDHLLFHPVSRRMIGAALRSDNGWSYAFVDREAGEVWRRVEQAFTGRSPSLVSWSHDLQHVVVHTIGARDPGSYYLADMKNGSVLRLGGAYDGVGPDQVAPVRAVEYAAADGLKIPGYLTTPPGVTDPKGLPLVVLPHGGPEAHDTRTFDYWAQALASRGYAVLQPNFRGSSGYGVAFTEAGYGEWGRKMQTDLSDGVRYLAAEGVIDPKRVCIVGASYGGYAALAGVTLENDVYRCAVSVSGVSDLRRMVDEEANMGVSRRDNPATRYWNRFMGADRLGDRSLDDRSPARLADRVNAPVLLIHGRDDTVVPIIQSRLMESALRRAGKPVEFVELSGEDHHMSKEATRLQMLEATVRFLETHNPVQ